MIEDVLRFVKRFAVLVPGLVIAFFAARDLYPFIDSRIPASLAILITYVITAYGLIPLSLRLVRIFLKPKHIPLYCTTPDGFASDPVNIGVIGTRAELIRAMKRAGWYRADKRTVMSLLRMGLAIVLKRPYHQAPFSNLYLFVAIIFN